MAERSLETTRKDCTRHDLRARHDNAFDISQGKKCIKQPKVQEDVEKETKDRATKSMKTLEFFPLILDKNTGR